MENNQRPVIIMPEGTTREVGSQAKSNNIMAGKILADVLKTTLGPRGMDKMLVNTIGDVKITNDGSTILKEIEPDHPAAQMIVDASKEQETNVEDGTTTVVVLTGELLKQAEKLLDEGISTSTILKGFKDATIKAKEVLNDISITDIKKENLVKIATTSMKGKGPKYDIEQIAEKLVEELLKVEKDGNINKDQIKLRKIHGESMESTEITEGVVVDKNVLESEMPKDVKNAKIALLQYPLDVKDLSNKAKIKITDPEELETYVKQEENLQKEEVDILANAGVNVLFCQKKISDISQHFLTKAGILSAKRVKNKDLERLSQATGAEIVNNIHELTEDDLGTAGHVYEKEVFEDTEYIFIEECKNPGTISIIVKGTTKVVTDQLEQAINDAIGAVSATLRNKKAIPGGGASDMAMAKQIKEYANTIGGKKQMAIIGFAQALEELPKALAHNAGLNTIDIMVQLKAAQTKSTNMGINVLTGNVSDMLEESILESTEVKDHILDSASEVTEQILRIDDVLAAQKQAPVGGDVGSPMM
ncbi:MAG: thermosome subunit alpha [Methanobacteriaceae archaeon]|nr:thermosome subunit alpha [Methanobacteriaceae archaeon]